MDKIAMYKEEIMKEASARKEYNKAVDEFNGKLKNIGLEDGIAMINNVEHRTEQKYPKTQMRKDSIKKGLLYAAPGMAASVAGSAIGNSEVKYLGQLGGFIGATVGMNSANKKRTKYKTEAIREELDSYNKATKKASETLDELVKEAGIVSHASRATNGIKRTGQLLTGSYARGLKKSLKNLSNKPAGSFQDSLKTGEKMMLTQKELGKEIGKVRATRAGVAGAVGVGALNTNKKEEPSI